MKKVIILLSILLLSGCSERDTVKNSKLKSLKTNLIFGLDNKE